MEFSTKVGRPFSAWILVPRVCRTEVRDIYRDISLAINIALARLLPSMPLAQKLYFSGWPAGQMGYSDNNATQPSWGWKLGLSLEIRKTWTRAFLVMAQQSYIK